MSVRAFHKSEIRRHVFYVYFIFFPLFSTTTSARHARPQSNELQQSRSHSRHLFLGWTLSPASYRGVCPLSRCSRCSWLPAVFGNYERLCNKPWTFENQNAKSEPFDIILVHEYSFKTVRFDGHSRDTKDQSQELAVLRKDFDSTEPAKQRFKLFKQIEILPHTRINQLSNCIRSLMKCISCRML